MRLTDTEKRMVARLQKQQESFTRWRWGILLSSMVSLGCGIFAMLILRQCFKPDFGSIIILAIGTPVGYLMMGMGIWLMFHTILNWNGKPEIRLLLKLIEESRDDA